MMSNSDGDSIRFEAPGEGPWELDSSHFDRPFPRYGRDLFQRAYSEGQAASFARAGVPAKTIRIEFVHGMVYGQLQPLVGPPGLSKMPPRWLFRLMSALHPTIRRRTADARRWMDGKGWREDLRRWDEEVKPSLSARFRTLQSVDPGALADEALVDHLEAAGAAMVDNFREHFLTNPATLYPVGTFLLEATQWSGCEPLEAIALVQGTGVSDAVGDGELHAVARALRDVPSGPALLNGGRSPGEALAALRQRSDGVGEAVRAWLEHVEIRALQTSDVSVPTGAEVPGLLVDHLRHAVTAGPRETPAPAAADRVRSRVPPEHHATFDELLAEARLVYRLRDERSALLDNWVMGLVRRALVEIGRRLEQRQLLQDHEHVVDVEHDELVDLLLRGTGPGADEVAARLHHRTTLPADDAPQVLGGELPPPPPLDYFPEHVARFMRALFFYKDHMEHSAPQADGPATRKLEGLAASGGTYQGPARIVLDPGDFSRVQPGDVVIARATMPTYNVLLPIIGALVTDRGGTLCHAAIVSREYGIPGVVGTREATARIKDGDLVLVDGDAGTVELLA